MNLDFSKLLFIDLESRSEVDVEEVGAYAYAEHPSTEILCATYAVGTEGEIIEWWPEQDIPYAWITDAQQQGYTWVAHNHEFEEEMLLKKYGLETGPWIDTATLCSIAGMPRNLHDCATSLKLPAKKLPRTAMLALCKPRKPSADNPARFWERDTRPDLFEQLIEYCAMDVRLMQLIVPKLPPPHVLLPPKEQRLAVTTDKMNKLGIAVDEDAVANAQIALKRHEEILRAEFDSLMPGVNPKSNVLLAKLWGLPDVSAPTIRDALKTEPEGPRRRAMELKQTIGMASTAKLTSIEMRLSSDGKYHGQMTFHGAGRTGRWSSMGVQLHNLKRGISDGKGGADPVPDWAFEALLADCFDMVCENPTKYIGAMMRGFFIGPFLIGDFSQIEARTLAGVAGQVDLLLAFSMKTDPYKSMASRIYDNKPIKLITKDERFMGKQAVLGCGYGLGRFGFMRMLAEIYDILIDEDEAQRVVTAYRQANPNIVSFWYSLERLIKLVVLEQRRDITTSPQVFGGRIGAKMYKSWLVIKLPSGRCLWYYEPELKQGDRGMELYYWGRNAQRGGHWERVKTYGGKLAENITQALSRDMMADAILRLEDAGYQPVLTVHDEILAPGEEWDLKHFKDVMMMPPLWWPEIPLDVEAHASKRYKK